MKQHNNWSGKDCPKEIRSGQWGYMTWNKFIRLIEDKLNPAPVSPYEPYKDSSVKDCTNELKWRGIIQNQELWDGYGAADEDIMWLFKKYYPYIMVNGGSIKDPFSVSTANEALHILNNRSIDTGPIISDKDLWIKKVENNEDYFWLLVKLADYIN